jgi:hypothetical protein
MDLTGATMVVYSRNIAGRGGPSTRTGESRRGTGVLHPPQPRELVPARAGGGALVRLRQRINEAFLLGLQREFGSPD